MNVNRRPPDDPIEWLSRAQSNLIQARARLEGVYLEDLCFAAQQAAEKAVKAVLLREGVEFPYVHDITALLAHAERAGLAVPADVAQAGRLTRYAVATRYPGFPETVTEEEYAQALSIAETVVQWAQHATTSK